MRKKTKVIIVIGIFLIIILSSCSVQSSEISSIIEATITPTPILQITPRNTEDIYNNAVLEFNNGVYELALNNFSSILDYKDSKEYAAKIDFIQHIQGTWCLSTDDTIITIISGCNVMTNKKSLVDNMQICLNNGEYLCLNNGDYCLAKEDWANVYSLSGNNLILSFNPYYKVSSDAPQESYNIDYNYHMEFVKISNETDISKPFVGMTKNQLKYNCTWGTPEDINTTTTAYGTDEQWCYSGYRYVYLENGIVTAIQE